jgi:thiol-disulfide isomerase/thioredoxin
MPRRLRFWLWLSLGSAVVIGVWLVREPLRHRIAESAVLTNPAPTPDLVEETIENSPDPAAAINAAWDIGRIVHRQVAVREIARSFSRGKELPAQLESIVLAASLDVDLQVRQTALGILEDHAHPALPAMAAAQLSDCDPEARLLGLQHLRPLNAAVGVPIVIPLLEDPDPLIVVTGLKLIEKWAGENFRVKVRDAVPSEDRQIGLGEFPPGNHETAKAGADRAKAWWAAHQAEFPSDRLEIPPEAIMGRKPVSAGDFSMRALDGRKVHLSAFRGKIVLLNFWTTWCPACVSEMAALNALQNQLGARVVVLGISLDFVPDDHGHIGGHPAVEEQAGHPAGHEAGEQNSIALKEVREKVARTVRSRGINYPILLDEKNEIGGRFNGGELPTTVLVDAEGNIRRRFVGARRLAVFAAMISEAAEPAPASQAVH